MEYKQIAVSKERYDELKSLLNPKEIEAFRSLIEKKTYILPVSKDVRTIDAVSDMDLYGSCEVGDVQYIFELSEEASYLVPLRFNSLEEAKDFLEGYLGSY